MVYFYTGGGGNIRTLLWFPVRMRRAVGRKNSWGSAVRQSSCDSTVSVYVVSGECDSTTPAAIALLPALPRTYCTSRSGKHVLLSDQLVDDCFVYNNEITVTGRLAKNRWERTIVQPPEMEILYSVHNVTDKVGKKRFKQWKLRFRLVYTSRYNFVKPLVSQYCCLLRRFNFLDIFSRNFWLVVVYWKETKFQKYWLWWWTSIVGESRIWVRMNIIWISGCYNRED